LAEGLSHFGYAPVPKTDTRTSIHSMVDCGNSSLTQIGHRPGRPLQNQKTSLHLKPPAVTQISSNLPCASDIHLSDARIHSLPILIRATTSRRPPAPDEITAPQPHRAYSAIFISAKGSICWNPVARVSMRVCSAARLCLSQ
jgi:hypothetical protein